MQIVQNHGKVWWISYLFPRHFLSRYSLLSWQLIPCCKCLRYQLWILLNLACWDLLWSHVDTKTDWQPGQLPQPTPTSLDSHCKNMFATTKYSRHQNHAHSWAQRRTFNRVFGEMKNYMPFCFRFKFCSPFISQTKKWLSNCLLFFISSIFMTVLSSPKEKLFPNSNEADAGFQFIIKPY